MATNNFRMLRRAACALVNIAVAVAGCTSPRNPELEAWRQAFVIARFASPTTILASAPPYSIDSSGTEYITGVVELSGRGLTWHGDSLVVAPYLMVTRDAEHAGELRRISNRLMLPDRALIIVGPGVHISAPERKQSFLGPAIAFLIPITWLVVKWPR
jgi:hypothetical protein